MKKEKKEYGRGGKREGSGRPRQFEEPDTINFKMEKADKVKLKERYGKELNQMFNAWVQSVLK